MFLQVVGTLWLALVLFSHGALHREEEVKFTLAPLAILYLIGIGIVALSAFGLYGALKEKQWALIVVNLAMEAMVGLITLGFNCCGVHGYQDWGNDIPGTCLCSDPTDNIRCVSSIVVLVTDALVTTPRPTMNHFSVGLLAVTFGFAVPVIAVTVMSIIILCQMRRKTITPSVKFRTDPTGSKYSELCETA
uniref:Tetraspanin n=1 Tax=Denticeps clupeoides TaxID=299321 RepID=A0AAY4BQE4_9TELE